MSRKETERDRQGVETEHVGRRRLIRALGVGGTGAVVAQWSKPIMDSVVVPLHAQTSPGLQVLIGSSRLGPLFRINTATGAGTLIGTMSVTATEIEYDRLTGRAFAQQSDGTFTITEINILTAATIGAPVGTGGVVFNGLEYVGASLYGTSIAFGNGPSTLRTLNPTTGASVAIGLTGVGQISGLAYDVVGGVMYGIGGGNAAPAVLYRINLATGAATAVGTTSITGAGSLEFAGGVLYAGGDNTNGGNLYRVNTATGASTLVGPSGFPSVTGLTLM